MPVNTVIPNSDGFISVQGMHVLEQTSAHTNKVMNE